MIVNPLAGGGRAGRQLSDVRAALEALGLPHHVEPTRSLVHARELALQATHAGETAVAFGGDGLIAAVADALRDTDGLLGVLPGGRGNDFARVLGIPLKARAACAVLATGVAQALDMGQVGSRSFIGIASCGIDSDANRIANQTTLVRGNLVYIYGALRALAGWRRASFTLTFDDGTTRTVNGYSVAAANSRSYGGGMRLAPEARLEDGLLDVVIISDMPKLRFLALLPTVFTGGHVRAASVEVLRCASLHVDASRPLTVYADGDPIGQLPVTIRALPGAVRVLVPAGRFDGDPRPSP